MQDEIVFTDGINTNLLPRWKYYLQKELELPAHNAIRAAIAAALNDPSFDHISFDVIEGTAQNVHTAVEFNSAAGFANLTTKYMKIVLETPATKGAIPLDPQF